MKKLFVLISTTLFVSSLFLSCGPAAEDRQAMLARAKVFQDSIANSIRSTMAEAEGPAPMPTPMPVPANLVAPTATTQAK